MVDEEEFEKYLRGYKDDVVEDEEELQKRKVSFYSRPLLRMHSDDDCVQTENEGDGGQGDDG